MHHGLVSYVKMSWIFIYRSIIIIICKWGILFSIRSNKRMPAFLHSLAEQIFGLFTLIHPWVCCARLELYASLVRIMITGFLTLIDYWFDIYSPNYMPFDIERKTRKNLNACKHLRKITFYLTSASNKHVSSFIFNCELHHTTFVLQYTTTYLYLLKLTS